MREPIELIRQLHRALESGAHGEALRALFTPDAITCEHPNLLKPTGARITLDQMLAASTAGAGLLASQRYEVRTAIASGARAALTLRWTGEVADDIGPFRAGQRLEAEIAQFVEAEAGRIRSIETFDCYSPITTGEDPSG